MRIDLNADLGESFGMWKMGADEELMHHVSSVNVACGFHAGDPTIIRRTIETALKNKVKIGAHPSFPDRQGFGRREMKMSPSEISDFVLYQVAAIKSVTEALGGVLSHVKPHGALYNLAARDRNVADAIASAVRMIDPRLVLVGLAGSISLEAARDAGLACLAEAFADRTYRSDGSLTPRECENALIDDEKASVEQVLGMIERNVVTSTDGAEVRIEAGTICLHGDSPQAVRFAASLKQTLVTRGIEIG